MRRRQKFNLVGAFIFLLAFVVWARGAILAGGYESFDAFAADALVYAIRASFIIVPVAGFYSYRNSKRPPFSLRPGRTARGWKCKRFLEETTGSNCQFCRWIRCKCGACRCGMGKLV